MGKYDKFNPRSRAPERPWKIHPIWRGIGCVTMVLIPVMSYAGAALLVQENLKQHWLPLPATLARPLPVPGLEGIPYLLANLLVAVVLAVVGYGVLVIAYSLMLSLSGAQRYGPLDAPPPERRPRRR